MSSAGSPCLTLYSLGLFRFELLAVSAILRVAKVLELAKHLAHFFVEFKLSEQILNFNVMFTFTTKD